MTFDNHIKKLLISNEDYIFHTSMSLQYIDLPSELFLTRQEKKIINYNRKKKKNSKELLQNNVSLKYKYCYLGTVLISEISNLNNLINCNVW